MPARTKPAPRGDDQDGTEAVLVSEVIPATRERIFAAWMNSEQHSAFTGEEAIIEPVVGGAHSSFAGYARGITLALDPYRRIVQSWRAREFPADCGDSTVEITLEETVGGTLVTLLHTEIPQGHSDRYRDSWLRSYLEPLKRYFTGRVTNGVHKADTQALRGKRAVKMRMADGPARKRKAGAKAKPRSKAKPRRQPAPPKGKKRTGAPRAAGKRITRVATAKTSQPSKRPGRKRPGSKSRPRKRS
jgi:uncharacterized protein YndB with AHSA1/START domain